MFNLPSSSSSFAEMAGPLSFSACWMAASSVCLAFLSCATSAAESSRAAALVDAIADGAGIDAAVEGVLAAAVADGVAPGVAPEDGLSLQPRQPRPSATLNERRTMVLV